LEEIEMMMAGTMIIEKISAGRRYIKRRLK